MPHAAREGFTIRVLRGDSATPAGVGFVVGDRHIVTCAHVVNTALGRGQRDQDRPSTDVRVQVDFPMLGDALGTTSRSCRIAAWAAPPATGLSGGDVAGLVPVSDGLPAGAGAARMIDAATLRDVAVKVFGYPGDPPRRERGAWSALVLRGAVGGGALQLDADEKSAIRTQPGYSGSPAIVTDEFGDAVVGMLTVAGRDDNIRDAYAMPVSRIAAEWPDLLGDGAVSPYPFRGLEVPDAAGGEGPAAAEAGPVADVLYGGLQGPREAALEAVKGLIALDDAVRGLGTLTYIADTLIVGAARIGGHTGLEVRRFRDRISERGLDARVLISQTAQHEEAVRRWAAPLYRAMSRGNENDTPLAMLASFIQGFAEELTGDLFTGMHSTCRGFLNEALRDVRSVQISAFVKAVDGHLPPLRSTSREAVLWKPSLNTENKADRSGNSDDAPSYRQLSLNAVAAQLCSLPDSDPYMVGRAEFISEIVHAISGTMAKDGKAVAFLSGQPGAGTSTVAIEVARELVPAFPGGVCYINLRGLMPGARRDARTVVRLTAEALKLQLSSKAMDDDLLFPAFAEQLVGKHVLLVLDDALDAKHVTPLVHAPATCGVIVTSRDRMQDYASPGLVFRVRTLARTASVELLARFMSEHSGEPSQLDTLARLCDDLPLALRLIGARIASYPDEDLGYLARTLEAEMTRLEYLEAGERGMRAAIRLSYDNLDPGAQLVFRFIPAVPGSIVAGMELAHCLSESPSRQEFMLNRLVDRSLADHYDIRTFTGDYLRTFSLFELVRLFAKEKLTEDKDKARIRAFQHRSVAYLRDRLREIVEEDHRAELSGELDPSRFHAAENLAEEQDWLDLAKDLAVDLHLLYLARREIDSILSVDDIRIRLHLRCGEYDDAITACLLSADGLRHMYATTKALASARRGRKLAAEHDLPIRTAQADFKISVLLADLEDWSGALKAGERAATGLIRLGHDAAAIPVTINNGKIARELGKEEDSLRWGRTATDLADRYGSTSQRADAALLRGRAEGDAGNYIAAVEFARSAKSLFEIEEDWWDSAVACVDGAWAAEAMGHIATEVELLSTAVDRLEHSTDDDRTLSRFIQYSIDLSAVHFEAGSFEQAFLVLQRADNSLLRRPGTVSALMRLELRVRTAVARWFCDPAPSSDAKIADIALPETSTKSATDSHDQRDAELEHIITILRSSGSRSTQTTAVHRQLSAFLATRTRHQPDPIPFRVNDKLGELRQGPSKQIAKTPGSDRALGLNRTLRN